VGLKLGKHHFEYQISNVSLKSLIMMNLKVRYQSKCSFREEKHDARIDFQAQDGKCTL
jgi:hypothetical protein